MARKQKANSDERYRDSLKYFPRQAWYFAGDVPRVIKPEGTGRAGGLTLGKLPFIVKPGQKVRWRDRVYTLKREGRYAFLHGCKLMRQVIVFRRDELALFRALAQIQAHGHRHDGLKFGDKIKAAQKGHLIITCHSISAFTLEILKGLGYRGRLITLLTLNEWNGYDNGHAILEYWSKQKRQWIVVDVDAHTLFRLKGKFLSAYQFHRAVVENKPYEIFSLSDLGKLDYQDLYQGKDFSTYCDPTFHNEQALHNWYGRVAQAVAMRKEEQGNSLFPEDDPTRIKRIESYREGNRCIPTAQWLAIFYPKPKR